MPERYSLLSAVWDLGSKLNGHTGEAEQFIKALPLDAREKIRILGCGAGTGIFEYEVLKHFPESHVTATDLNQEMLDVLKKKTSKPDYENRVRLKQGDIRAVLDELLQHEQGTYDLAIAGGLFEHIEHPTPVLQQIHALLKDQGIFLQASLRETFAGRAIGWSCGVRPLSRDVFIQVVENNGFKLEESRILPCSLGKPNTWKNVWVKWLKKAHYFRKV